MGSAAESSMHHDGLVHLPRVASTPRSPRRQVETAILLDGHSSIIHGQQEPSAWDGKLVSAELASQMIATGEYHQFRLSSPGDRAPIKWLVRTRPRTAA